MTHSDIVQRKLAAKTRPSPPAVPKEEQKYAEEPRTSGISGIDPPTKFKFKQTTANYPRNKMDFERNKAEFRKGIHSKTKTRGAAQTTINAEKTSWQSPSTDSEDRNNYKTKANAANFLEETFMDLYIGYNTTEFINTIEEADDFGQIMDLIIMIVI